jgi:FkbM family methyltransferase
MDLGRIKAYGRSTTGKAWVTNPLRSVLWWLARPYFQGVGAEIERRRQTESAEIEQRRQTESAKIEQLWQTEGAKIEQRWQTEQASLRREASAVASYVAGARKDAMAVAHRMAGLEEEAAAKGQACVALGERLAGLEEEAAAKGQACVERLGTVAAEAHAAAAYVASLHQDVISSVQALNDRIDLLVGAPTAQDTLVLAATTAGTHFLVRPHDLIGRRVADGQEWEPHVRVAIERAAQSDGVAVDAGAYIGLHTVTMSRVFGTVHSFEPQRGIYQLLCANLALNGCANVVTHNLALYDRASPMRLAPPERQEVSTPMRDGQPDYARIANAAALTFEVVDGGSGDVCAVALDELNLEGLSLIKVDTQGADLRVLRGAEATIRRCRPVILFEWERDLGEQHGAALEDYQAFFADLDYDLAVLQQTSPGRQTDYLATPR